MLYLDKFQAPILGQAAHGHIGRSIVISYYLEARFTTLTVQA